MDKLNKQNSSSWVFVYGNVNPSESISKAFHLDCSQEPIQELTEQDLSLPGSDIESDKGTDTSDGISIISESEIPLEENYSTYSDCSKIDDIHDTQIVENRITCTNPLCVQSYDEHDKEWDWKKLFTPLNLVSAGVVVSAVLVALYSSIKIPEDVAPEESILIFDSAGIANNFDEIVDKTISCACNEKRKQAYETEAIKQCVYNRLNNNGDPTAFKGNKMTKIVNEKIDVNFSNNDKKDQEARLKKSNHSTAHKHDKKSHYKKEKQQKHLNNNQAKASISGEWYSKMHQHRAELRKQNEKKNRAQWYFKRVNARQQARNNKKYNAYSG